MLDHALRLLKMYIISLSVILFILYAQYLLPKFGYKILIQQMLNLIKF